MESDSILSFNVTREQAERICKYYGKQLNEVEDYEVCDMLDSIINELEVDIEEIGDYTEDDLLYLDEED